MLKRLLILAALSPTLVFNASASPTKVSLTGAGATFPFPIYSKWFDEYGKKTGAQINYQSIGSGAGIKQITERTVDFGASDVPMTDDQLAKAGNNIMHIPTVLGAVVVTYNLPGLTSPLTFTGELISDMFLGKITKWSDPKIAALNPGVKLPDLALTPVSRSDGSGTTGVFTDYLSKVSPEWKSSVGQGAAVKFRAGLGGKGNEGVTATVKNTPGAVGYVELIYAEKTGLPAAKIKNQAGAVVAASIKSVTAAAAGAIKDMPSDFRVSITNAPGKDAYPIASFTYLLAYRDMTGPKGVEFTNFVRWALNEGQKSAEAMSYAPLPKPLKDRVLKAVNEIKTK